MTPDDSTPPAFGRGEDEWQQARGTSIDPKSLMRIKSLQLRARAVVEGFMRGIHRSPYHGFSVEFTEYRQYSPGDDTRHLDWRLFARSDRYYVKKFEDETNLRCTIVLDTSRSMAYGSGGVTKGDYARTAAATLAHFLSLQRDAIGLITFEDQLTGYLAPRHRPGQLRRMMGMLDREPLGRASDLATPLEQAAATIKRRGLVVLISDLLAPAGNLGSKLAVLRAQGHEMLVIRVLDPAEVEFTFETPSLFRDAESGRQLYIDPATARASYLDRFNAHAAEIAAACKDHSIDLQSITTDRPLDLLLFDLLKSRARRINRRARGARAARSQPR